MTTTDRLTLVPVRPGHAAELEALHRDPVIARWSDAWTPEQALAWATDMSEQWRLRGAGKWMAYRRSDGSLVGRGGLSWTDLEGEQRLEVGWAVRAPYRGQGYATEIGRAGLSWAFDTMGAAEVYAFTEVHNRASRAVMVRLGMVEVGVIHRPGLVEGRDGIQEHAPFALFRATS